MTTQSYTLPLRKSIWQSSTLKLAGGGNRFAMPIVSVVVKGTANSDGTLFHFCLSFVGENDTSILLDMTPTYSSGSTAMQGILVVEYKKYTFSTSTGPEAFTAPVKQGTDAATLFYCLLDRNALDQYNFNDSGQGCRHWCAIALTKLAASGLVNEDIAKNFVAWEQKQAPIYGDKFPMPRIEGSLY